MTDLIEVQKIAGWEKLKALVLDSISSERMAGIARGAQARLVVDHRPHVGDPQAGRGGCG
jgi:hypothetical protein